MWNYHFFLYFLPRLRNCLFQYLKLVISLLKIILIGLRVSTFIGSSTSQLRSFNASESFLYVLVQFHQCCGVLIVLASAISTPRKVKSAYMTLLISPLSEKLLVTTLNVMELIKIIVSFPSHPIGSQYEFKHPYKGIPRYFSYHLSFLPLLSFLLVPYLFLSYTVCSYVLWKVQKVF